jgi:transcriptional regulator with PAS, ATPase and Fis domain
MAKRTDARIVVATNQDLNGLLAAGKFRKDLYYRLGDHHIHLPPLRERLEDLPLLVAHFLEKASETLRRKKPTPPDELITLLGTYHFPGNIRRSWNPWFLAVSSHKSGKLFLETFRLHISQKQTKSAGSLKTSAFIEKSLIGFSDNLPTLKQAEQLLIDEALRRSHGNQSIAALSLGISRQALNKRLRKADL